MGKILTQEVTDQYAVWNGDAMEVMPDLPDGSVHLSVYSPPFASGNGALYHYSSSDRDLSNAGTYAGFFEMYRYFVREIARITMPGRISAVHCMDVPTGNSGGDAYLDFPGDIIRLHAECGFSYVARHSIWKEPLKVRNRTMKKDLAHRTIVDDAVIASVASADYLLIFRRHGDNPVPVSHPNGFTEYYGARRPPADLLRYRGWTGKQTENLYSHWVWRQYASSVWDDVRGNLGRPDDDQGVLPFRESRDQEDERHVHPLQLDVIYRAVAMRTNPGERVFTPCMGVGSEVYGAVRLNRYGMGVELKPSYYRQTLKNLASLRDEQHEAPAMLDLAADGETLGEAS
jgi:DNA modification methylase